jgi:hypothetical protein
LWSTGGRHGAGPRDIGRSIGRKAPRSRVLPPVVRGRQLAGRGVPRRLTRTSGHDAAPHLYVPGDRPDMPAGTHALGGKVGNRVAAADSPAQAPITTILSSSCCGRTAPALEPPLVPVLVGPCRLRPGPPRWTPASWQRLVRGCLTDAGKPGSARGGAPQTDRLPDVGSGPRAAAPAAETVVLDVPWSVPYAIARAGPEGRKVGRRSRIRFWRNHGVPGAGSCRPPTWGWRQSPRAAGFACSAPPRPRRTA